MSSNTASILSSTPDRTVYFKDHPAVEMAVITMDGKRTFYMPAAVIDRLVNAVTQLVSREEAHAWYKKIGVIGPDDIWPGRKKSLSLAPENP